MAKIIWSPQSKEDLLEIKEYISRNSPTQATRFVEKLIEYPNRLLTFPNSGRDIPACDIIGAKEVFYKEYRIAFRIINDHVEF
jgi:toxin ParE1/3/4